MTSPTVNGIEELRQRWMRMVEDVTPSLLPTQPVPSSSGCDSYTYSPLQICLNTLAIQTFCEGNHLAPLDLIRAAWAGLLEFYTGSEDVLFGAIGSWPRAETEQCTAISVCRAKVRPDYGVMNILNEIQEEVLESDHLIRLSGALDILSSFPPKRFNSTILVQDPLEELGADLSQTDLFTFSSNSMFDYLLQVNPSLPGNFGIHLIYRKTTISHKQAECVAGTFADLLLSICTVPNQSMFHACQLSNFDKLQLEVWNHFIPVGINTCVDRLIMQTAERTPNAPALVSWEGEMTYIELSQGVSRLSFYLDQAGIREGQLVPICFEKSPWALMTMIALWQLGAAFVPLDPGHPPQRLQTIISRIEADTVLVSALCKDILQNGVPHVIEINSDLLHNFQDTKGSNFVSRSKPQDTAFVMFTSGSTGNPKGVVHDHAAVCSSALHHGPAMGITAGTRALQFAAYTFIVSTFEIFTPLIMGGCLCIPSEHDRRTDIRPALTTFRANWAIFTPSFVRSINPTDVPDLQTLMVAGEPVQQDIIDSWAERNLTNIYGSTECSVCMVGKMTKGQTPRTCIGRATGGLSWIVDPTNHDRLVPIGTQGELLIEGPILAQGYLSDTERTKKEYIENPNWARFVGPPSPRRRFYKTGDLVRYGDDGDVHLIGRIGTQVKIRGQRVDLTEIEAHLGKMSSKESLKIVVSMLQSEPKSLLVAFISSRSGFGPEFDHEFHVEPQDKATLSSIAARLREELTTVLPSHMIPAAFIPLSYMPLTASSKADRRRVSAFASTLSISKMTTLVNLTSRRAPSTAMEAKLQLLWADILGLAAEEIGADDRFFHLGGNSIEAINLSRKCRREGFLLQVQDILANPTLSEIAKKMAQSTGLENIGLPPFVLLGENVQEVRENIMVSVALQDWEVLEDAYPCTPLQHGLMALSIRIPGSYVAQHTLALPVSLSINSFQQIWQHIVESNAAMRTRIIETDMYGCVQAVVRSPIEWNQSTSLKQYLVEDKRQGMQMGDALARHAIVHGDGPSMQTYYVLTIHHAIYDGLSLAMLFDDLQQAVRGTSINTRPQPNIFIRHVLDKNGTETKEFWKSQLSGVNLATFPTLPSVTYQPLANASITHNIDFQRSSQSDFTATALIQAAWALLQGRYCDSYEIVFGCVLSGRSSAVSGVQDIVGPVIATVPVKFQLDKQQQVKDFLRHAQEQFINMIPYQNYGLQNIARLGDRASAACRFQTMLVVQPKGDFSDKSNDSLQPFSTPWANFSTVALTLECNLSASNIVVHAHFDNVITSELEVNRIMKQFEHILLQLNREPSGRLSDIEIISPQDKRDILYWNRAISKRVDDCIHRLIEEQTVQRPNAAAICSFDGNITYSQLEDISSKVAEYLINVGVSAEVFVPFCFEKSTWAIVAMLAILKAGGAFVPLDPEAPRSRLVTIVKEVRARIMLCSEEQLNRHPDLVEKAIAIGPGFDATIPDGPCKSPTTVEPGNAAYVIFTSGSTGTPKGIVVEHRAFCTGASVHKERLQMKSRVLQFASYTFDASLLDILSTLTQGGCVCVPSESERRGDIAGAISRMQVNWTSLTPSFASTIDPRTVPSLETLCLNGEPLSAAHIEAWAPYVELMNGYGPTECCITTSVKHNVTIGSNPSDIGTGIGIACWIVDYNNHDQLAPVGCIGELLVEGHTLARHYLNQEEKTSAAFIPRPSWLPWDRCDRVYKTGDIVRYGPDGSMLFVGRKDTQLKIRGQRVELGEIEYQLLTHRDVALAVVTYPKTGIYSHKLIAILEASNPIYQNPREMSPIPRELLDTVGFDISSISRHVSQRLPIRMVPTIWIVVGKIPISPSAKIHRGVVDEWLTKLPPDFQPAMGTDVQDTPLLAVIGMEETKAIAISEKIADLVSYGDELMRTTLRKHDFPIASAGIDSVQVISLITFIKKHYDVKVNVEKILDKQTTVRSLVDFIESKKMGQDINDRGLPMDVKSEASLLIKGMFNPSWQPAKTIFVTGVTSLLGTQILRQLCDRSDVAKVIAHVRASTSEEALDRLKDAANRAKWWSDGYLSRITAWPGNLSKPQLGLTSFQWASLTGRGPSAGVIDAIIHAGAAVNWNAGYEILRATNVYSTIELIKAVMMSPVRPRLVYVSGGHRWHLGEKDDHIAQEVAGSSGYSQTKYISELLIKHFAADFTKASQFSIIKPGLIVGTPEEGVTNTDDFIWRLASSIVDIQAYSADHPDSWIFVTSAARVAEETICQTVCTPERVKTVVYITDGILEQNFWDIFRKKLQYHLRPMSHAAWLDTMLRSINNCGGDHPLWPVLQGFEAIQGRLGREQIAIRKGEMEIARTAHVEAAIRKSIEFLIDVGFIASPSGRKGLFQVDKVFQRARSSQGDLAGL